MSVATPSQFWALLEQIDGCLVWTGFRKKGYGYVEVTGELAETKKPTKYGRRLIRTHRLAWIIKNGKIAENVEVLHRCDNPPCCDPEHLFLGTQADNIKDAAAKGRMRSLGWTAPSLYIAR